MKIVRNLFSILLGGVAALIHLVVILLMFANKGNYEGSWGAFLPFLLDFPASIVFLWLSDFVPLVLLHAILGSLWWFSIGWLLIKAVTVIVDLLGAK